MNKKPPATEVVGGFFIASSRLHVSRTTYEVRREPRLTWPRHA